MKQTHLNTSSTLQIGECKRLIAQIHAKAESSRLYKESPWMISVKKRLGITTSDLENCFTKIKKEAVA